MISARLRQNRKPGRRSGRRDDGASHGMSSLIPMIDMLTILVVYLLVHAADYEILPNIKEHPDPAVDVGDQAARDRDRADNERCPVRERSRSRERRRAQRAGRSAVIEPLKRVLVAEAGKRMLKDKDDPTSHEVTVLADKDLPYSFLKKILSTCTAAEYGKVSLAVLERERAYSGPGAV